MIQRIQSVFFLISAILLLSLFKLPFATSNISTTPFFEDLLFTAGDHIVLIILAALGGGIGLLAIFLFKNRPLQLRLSYLGIICSLFMALVAFWLIYSHADEIQNIKIDDEPGMFFPIGSMIFFIAANYFIKKDEKLVKSMDRLR